MMVTAGVSHGLGLAVGRLSRPGDMIVVECPTYFLVTPIFRDNHLTVVPIPTDEYGMVVDELERWLRKDPSNRPRLVYIIPIHNNPRGTTLPPDRRRHLLRLAAEYDFVVLADEVYQLLTFPEYDRRGGGLGGDGGPADGGATVAAAATCGSAADVVLPPDAAAGVVVAADAAASKDDGGASALAAAGTAPAGTAPTAAPLPPSLPLPLRCYEDCDPRVSRVISFGSFSKMLAPALRLGWLETSNPSLLERCREDGVVSSGGCIAQLATGVAHSALYLGLQATHLDGVVRPQLAARCTALVSALRRHLPPACLPRPASPSSSSSSPPSALVEPRGGYFLWMQLDEAIDSPALLRLAEQRHGVRFTPGPSCGGGPAHCLRMSFSFYKERELEEGARRLGAAVRDFMGSPRQSASVPLAESGKEQARQGQ